MTAKIQFQIVKEIATVTLNRPEKLHALDPEMLAGLEEIAQELDQNKKVRVAILTGTGERAFSVGADIKAWSALKPIEMWSDWVRNGHRVFDRWAQLKLPVIAAINGFAFGGGLELALTADLRLAADHAEFAMPEVKLGTVPGWGATGRLPELIGISRAKQLILSGERINAGIAERWGLVNETMPAASLLGRAQALASTIAGNSPIAVQISKQLLNLFRGPNSSVVEGLADALAAATEDGQEGLAAYREKRMANFKGL